MEFSRTLLSSNGFMPHGFCYMWTTRLILLHLVSDSLIALAYLCIPITLVYFIRFRHDLPFNWVFVCFGAFILACGAAHAMEVWTLWHATYWLSGAIKAVTALASVSTAASKDAPPKVRTLAEAEREHILRTLRETDWVIGRPEGAAAQLEVRRTTLICKMRRLGIIRPQA
jgi:hypothetical protein